MELELGLALPSYNLTMIQGLDLNRYSDGLTTETQVDHRPKRSFLEDHVEATTLSLRRENGGCRQPKCRKLHAKDESSDDDCQVIEGWPPVISSWKETSRRHQGGSMAVEQVKKSIHVKVKMGGVAIGRKVDLRHYDSYQALTNTLIDMFAKYSKIDGNREGYTLLYQDKEGDWMLVGDVQWEIFVESVQRVEILKNDNKMGFQLLSRKVLVRWCVDILLQYLVDCT